MNIACRTAYSCLCAALFSLVLATSAVVPVEVAVIENSTEQPNVVSKSTVAAISSRDLSLAVASKPPKMNRERFTALQRSSHRPARDGGHFLTNKELAPIKSVHCLQEMQQYPHRPCPKPDATSYALDTLRIGHYPSWKDATCHSHDEFFCDPRDMLTTEQRSTVTDQLRLLKERTLVNCGQLNEVLDPDVERRWFEKKHPVFSGRLGLEDYREFNFAVALADEWPSTEMDPKSMQYFGRVVMTEWGLMPIYNGVDNGNPVNQFHSTWHNNHDFCPNTAVLFILPKYHEAFVMSPSCEFICESRGGPEVVAATLAGLDNGGVEAAILAGIEEFGKVLKVTLPLSIQKVPARKRFNRGYNVAGSDGMTWAVRAAFALVIILLVVFGGSLLYYIILPGQKQRRTGYQLMGDAGREGLREEGIFA